MHFKALHKIDFDAVPSLHLFDSLIALILNYNSEVWSQLSKQNLEAINNNDYKLEKLFFDTPREKLQLQFCRNISGEANMTRFLNFIVFFSSNLVLVRLVDFVHSLFRLLSG